MIHGLVHEIHDFEQFIDEFLAEIGEIHCAKYDDRRTNAEVNHSKDDSDPF